jgi:hypothetical protein
MPSEQRPQSRLVLARDPCDQGPVVRLVLHCATWIYWLCRSEMKIGSFSPAKNYLRLASSPSLPELNGPSHIL